MTAVAPASRRGFLQTMFSAGALLLRRPLFAAADAAHAAWRPSVCLGVETDGTVIIVAHRSEMGTGIRTALPMVLADEMEADWKRVRIEQAPADPKYGSQATDGSVSIRDFYLPMREAGAAARLMLTRAAAGKWRVPVSECRAREHQVEHSRTGRKLGFGELASLAARQPLPRKEESHSNRRRSSGSSERAYP
jgi:isoquinoline 1-oxidoreductase subunit beta